MPIGRSTISLTFVSRWQNHRLQSLHYNINPHNLSVSLWEIFCMMHKKVWQLSIHNPNVCTYVALHYGRGVKSWGVFN